MGGLARGRKTFHALLALIVLGAACGCGEPRYRQVILVTVDTLRADHLPIYGYARPTTPFLGELAESGVVFTRAHATMSLTAPSHASMFTSLLPAQHGLLQNGDKLEGPFPTLAGVLRREGFRTAAFTSASFLQRTATGFRTVQSELRKGDATLDRALQWVERLEPDEPFFLWIHLFDVHEAGIPGAEPPEEFYAAVRDGTELDRDALYDHIAELQGLPRPAPGEPFPEIPWESIDNGRPLVRASKADILESVDEYDAQIAFVDSLIERLYRAVQGLGSDTPRLWIVTSDHGEGLGSHGYRGHDSRIYQEQLRVPLIFHATDGKIGPGRDESLVSLVDLFPTLLDAVRARIERRDTLEGVSLWSRLLGRDAGDESRTVFAQRKPMPLAENGMFTVLSGDSKYILQTGAEDEFFDLRSDPHELHGDTDSPEAARLLDLATRKLDETGWEALLSLDGDALPPEVMDELRALGYVE